MDQCGEASAAAKLSALTLQDRHFLTTKKSTTTQRIQNENQLNYDNKVEYFEFAKDETENWGQEFKKTLNLSLNIDQELTNKFEKSFNKNIQDQWVKSFHQLQQGKEIENEKDQKEMERNFEKFNQIFAGDQFNWAEEFSKHELIETENNNKSEWTDEFLNNQNVEDDDKETARSARILLESLDLSDSKLADSKFVAYLKELTENDSTINGTYSQDQDREQYNWEKEFQRNMEMAGLSGDVEDEQWKNLDKAWDKYAFSGHGYEQFATREFANYRYSLEDALNPFHGLGSEAIKSELPELKLSDGARYILALEELTRLRPTDPEIWKNLGQAQAENELDVQAIGAFHRAVQLDPKMNSAWLGLGAGCVNEYCVPDALEAFKNIAVNSEPSLTIKSDDLLNNLISIFKGQVVQDETVRVGALSVLLNIAGEHWEAIALLNNLAISTNDYSVWNRLGATLANSKRYDEALSAYEQALNLKPKYVRALYNMGVSHMNQSNYSKSLSLMTRALQHHLSVSNKIDPSIVSEALRTGYDTIWNTMRIVGDMWGREDINVLIEKRNLNALKNILE